VQHPAKVTDVGSFSCGVVDWPRTLPQASLRPKQQQDQRHRTSAAAAPSQHRRSLANQLRSKNEPPYSTTASADRPEAGLPPVIRPRQLTVPAGTILLIRMKDYLSTITARLATSSPPATSRRCECWSWRAAAKSRWQVKEVRQAGGIRALPIGSQLRFDHLDGAKFRSTELWKLPAELRPGATVGTTTGLGAYWCSR